MKRRYTNCYYCEKELSASEATTRKIGGGEKIIFHKNCKSKTVKKVKIKLIKRG